MTRTRTVLVALAAVLVVAVVGFLVLSGDDGDDTGTDPGPTGASSDLPVVADETWCQGWQGLVVAQGRYVAEPSAENSRALLALVDDLQALGVPESLAPSGHTELTAVLDDIRASADPSFTPTVVPSEPADVPVEGEHDDHGAEADEAPFGAWLAEHCAV